MGWASAGLAAAAGGLLGLLAGGAVGASVGGRREPGENIIGRATGTAGGAATGALVGVALGSFIGAALATPAASSGGSTIVVNPGTNPPTPQLPPAPPAPVGPPPPNTAASDPILTDTQSIFAARIALGNWWAAQYQASPADVNNQLYTPVLLVNGVLGADPNFVNALAYFQQYVNAKAQPADFASIGLPITALPYTNGTLDTYTLQLLQYVQTHPNA